MARGWESKSIESQQDAAADARPVARPALTPEEAARRTKRDTLQLARLRALGDLQRACAPAHRAMLLSLQRAAAAYDGLAFAARRNASGTWARASLAVERADQAFRDAFRALAPLGYRIAA